MKIHTSDKIMAYMALFSGLTISAVAIYYSVAGLVSIFAAAAVPIIIMGAVLEISKLIATLWLKLNWQRAPIFIRTYLLLAIAILMLITSMGIFGFLSKAHSDQNLVSGDVQSRIAVYDERIKTARDNIEANRRALTQMDAQVDQVLGRTDDARGAERAVQIRRNQAKERTNLQNEIAKEQKLIAQLNEESAPIRAEVRQVEAKVGPLKYIAALIYGDNPDANILEKAVTWVIIIIVVVFDPLAVILLLASQYSFQWFRKDQEENDKSESEEFFENAREVAQKLDKAEGDSGFVGINVPWPFMVSEEPKVSDDPHPPGWMFKNGHLVKQPADDIVLETVAEEDVVTNEEDDTEILNSVSNSEKAAMSAWKHDHPNSSLKLQRRLFEKGSIKELPWKEYLSPTEAATEAKKWAEENAHTEEGRAAQEWANEKNNEQSSVSWMETDDTGKQIKKTKDTYQQNAEQSDRTLWQRIQDAKK
jgi:hypothetical protein